MEESSRTLEELTDYWIWDVSGDIAPQFQTGIIIPSTLETLLNPIKM